MRVSLAVEVILLIVFLVGCGFIAWYWRWFCGQLIEGRGPLQRWAKETVFDVGYYSSTTFLGLLLLAYLFSSSPVRAATPAATSKPAAVMPPVPAPASTPIVLYPSNYKGPEMYGVPQPKGPN